MFSLPKLLVLLLIIGGVIAAFRLAGTVRRLKADAAARAEAEARAQLRTEELLKCPTCGAYGPAGSREPGDRAECPHCRAGRGG